MSSELSNDDINIKVEILTKRYLEKRERVSVNQEPMVSVMCEENAAQYLENYNRALKELFKAISNQPKRFVCDEIIYGSAEEHSDKTDETEEILRTETDVSLPSSLLCMSSSLKTEPAWFSREDEQTACPTSIGQVYQQMLQIYQKLQTLAAEFCERERKLQQREKLFLKHQNTLHRLCTVKEDVLDRMNSMQKEHLQEMDQLRVTLREKSKENKRIKSSFDSIKEVNDTLRKQLNAVSEMNAKLESQFRKVQTRLENLQRKHEYSVTHQGQENVAPKSHGPKPFKQDKPTTSTKASKSGSSFSSLKLLSSLLDWIVDDQSFQSEDIKTESQIDLNGISCFFLHERCAKLLPGLVQQLQQAEPFLQLPLLRFIYCFLTKLKHSTQQLLLTSTLRRLGEVVRQKSPPLLKSSCLETRYLSSVIILKTISQVDILAQTLDVLHGIIEVDEGRGLFVKYRGLAAVLSLLRTCCPGLVARSLDILSHMSVESRHLPAFLEMCSTDQFFRFAASLLRNPSLDLAIAEKLAILLEKLSGIRKNRRLFEASSLHLLLQEMHCSADPARAFLNINFSSILYNLGMTTHNLSITSRLC